MASPTLLIGSAAVITYVRRDLTRAFTLGRLGPGPFQARVSLLLERVMPSLAAEDSTDQSSRRRRQKDPRPLGSGFYTDGVFVFVVQLAAMLLIAALFMHIQVCTRRRNASRVVYPVFDTSLLVGAVFSSASEHVADMTCICFGACEGYLSLHRSRAALDHCAATSHVTVAEECRL